MVISKGEFNRKSVNMVDFRCADPYSNMLSLNLKFSFEFIWVQHNLLHFKNFEFIKLKGLSSWNWCQPIRKTLLWAYEIVESIWKPILDRLEYYELRWPVKNRFETKIGRILGESKINRIFCQSVIDRLFEQSELIWIDRIF